MPKIISEEEMEMLSFQGIAQYKEDGAFTKERVLLSKQAKQNSTEEHILSRLNVILNQVHSLIQNNTALQLDQIMDVNLSINSLKEKIGIIEKDISSYSISTSKKIDNIKIPEPQITTIQKQHSEWDFNIHRDAMGSVYKITAKSKGEA